MRDEGRVRAVGVSNFLVEHLEEPAGFADQMPASPNAGPSSTRNGSTTTDGKRNRIAASVSAAHREDACLF